VADASPANDPSVATALNGDSAGFASENDGGKAGELELTRSEIAVIRRAARYDYPPEERDKTVKALIEVRDTSKSRRTIIASAKALTEIDKVNMEDERRRMPPVSTGAAVQVNVNVGTSNDDNRDLESLSVAELAAIVRAPTPLQITDQDQAAG
jgi:hypothetical protein